MSAEFQPDDRSFNWEPDWEIAADIRLRSDSSGLPVILTDSMIPLDTSGQYVPSHLDEEGVLHFFAAAEAPDSVESGDQRGEFRYFRAAVTDDDRLVHDSYPVMPLGDGRVPFPGEQLMVMLEDGDVSNAQELAYLTARSHGLPFPEPEHLLPLNTSVIYAGCR